MGRAGCPLSSRSRVATHPFPRVASHTSDSFTRARTSKVINAGIDGKHEDPAPGQVQRGVDQQAGHAASR